MKNIILALAVLTFSTTTLAAPWDYQEGKDYVDQEVRRSNEYTLATGEKLADDIYKNTVAINDNYNIISKGKNVIEGNIKKLNDHEKWLNQNSEDIKANSEAIDQNTQDIKANSEAIDQHTQDIKAVDEKHEKLTSDTAKKTFTASKVYTDSKASEINNEFHQKIQNSYNASKEYTDRRVDSLENKVNDNNDKANAGIASVAAMSTIPFVHGQRLSFGVGLGHRINQQGFAMGVNFEATDNAHVRLNVATDTTGEQTFGAGFAIGFR